MKKINLGILANVDAGKTSLSEALLYKSGSLRSLGRVDKQSTFLDNNEIERERGITVFSKQARLSFNDMCVTLIDTPGHADFSAETERTLSVLDYALLVINGSESVRSHTLTIWKLLDTYNIPVFIFINKLDMPQADRESAVSGLKSRLSPNIVEFDGYANAYELKEEIAVCDEELLEEFMSESDISSDSLRRVVSERKLFPCVGGSATKLEGIDRLAELISELSSEPEYGREFSAAVYKIGYDEQGVRLTHLKITGGSLKNRELINGEKVNQIRLYSGNRYEAVNEAFAGDICSITGPANTFAGQIIGEESTGKRPVLEPVLMYDIRLPEGVEARSIMPELKRISEEVPELNIEWDSERGRIRARLMGSIQVELLKRMVSDRCNTDIELEDGGIVYKESIADIVEGVGHFEPLRHYAEVHLLMRPGIPGEGNVFDSDLSEDRLPAGYQKLILSHLREKEHIGVLTGSPVTDIHFTLAAGRAHLKHTEGGDFREAAYRAVRQGLMQAKSILLEPYYRFELILPADCLGRALNDMSILFAVFESPDIYENEARICGVAPVACIQNYQSELNAYTRGEGRLYLALAGYRECHNTEEIMEKSAYIPELDAENPCGSVFCSHGAGFYVPWNEVHEYMHEDSGLGLTGSREEDEEDYNIPEKRSFEENRADSEELMEIFERTYGKVKPRIGDWDRPSAKKAEDKEYKLKELKPVKEYLLVDGYNVIFSSEELSEFAKINIDSARARLMDMLSNYQGYKRYELILVFDAYKVEGHGTEIFKYHNIYVVYTKEAETADQYIEKTAHEIGHKYKVYVATSDGLEQIIIRSQGCILLSSRELLEDMERAGEEIRKEHLENRESHKNYLFDSADKELKERLERVRLGKETL